MSVCIICGRSFDGVRYLKPFDDVCGSECFDEKLWRLREEEYVGGEPYIIINGTLYSDGGYIKNPRNTTFLGYGGQEFNIKMKTGGEIFTNNLWCGGDIPENHREILCDNAVFINDFKESCNEVSPLF